MLFTAAVLLAPLAAVAVVAQDSCPKIEHSPEAPPQMGQVWAPDMTNNSVSDDPVFFLAPGLGSCGFNYTDATPGVCLSAGNVKPKDRASTCNELVEMTLTSTGITTYGRVVDTCGSPEPNSTFGCNDIYVTKSLFINLAGGNQTILNAGNLGSAVSWRFLEDNDDNVAKANSSTPDSMDLGPLTKTVTEYTSHEKSNYSKDTSFTQTTTTSGADDAHNDDGVTDDDDEDDKKDLPIPAAVPKLVRRRRLHRA